MNNATQKTTAALMFGLMSLNIALAQHATGYEENQGQWDARAAFLCRTPGLDVWVTASGVVYDFHRTSKVRVPDFDPRRWTVSGPTEDLVRRGHVVRGRV